MYLLSSLYNYLGISVSSGMLYLNLGWEKGKNLEKEKAEIILSSMKLNKNKKRSY